MYRWLMGFMALLMFAFVGNDISGATGSKKFPVFVSILPQAYFVERVGGPFVDVSVLVGPGQSPATYEPTPKQMVKLGKSRIYFRIGTPFEKGFVDKISDTFKGLVIVDTREKVPIRFFRQSGGESVPDPHIWLDPKRVKIQAETIAQTLAGMDSEHAAAYRGNLQAFLADLDRVDDEIARVLAPLAGRKIYVFHPAFGYFCESYGLEQVAFELEGKEPSPKQLSRLIDQAKKDGVKIVFVQPQFSAKGARTIARAIGGAVVPMNPLPRDYLKNLEDMATIIQETLSKN